MAKTSPAQVQLLVVTADGVSIKVSPAQLAGFKWPAGAKLVLVDAATGKTIKGVVAKKVGAGYQLESPELTEALPVGASDDLAKALPSAGVDVQADAPSASSGGGDFSFGSVIAGALGLGLAGGGGGGTVASVIALASGTAIDGYLQGATVTRVNGTGNSVLTDANGNFSGLSGTGPIQVSGGYQLVGGQQLPFQGTLVAPAGSKVVTPITTLIQAVVDSGQTPEDALAFVTQKLQLPAGFDVLNTDPIAVANDPGASPAAKEAALDVFKTGVAVATVL